MVKDNDLSVIILVKNEAKVILKCLESVKLINPRETILIDDDSEDDIVSVVKGLDVKVINYKKKNFADARNFAASMSNQSWLLYVDADEIISPELALEIRQVIINKDISGYFIPRMNYFLGKKWLKVEYLERLIQKNKLINWYGDVHESPKIIGKTNQLKGFLKHYTHKSLSEMTENTIIWSDIESNLRLHVHHPKITWWRIPRVMIPIFWDYFVVQKGWKIGTIGLIESLYQAFSIFITYARLWEKQNKLINKL